MSDTASTLRSRSRQSTSSEHEKEKETRRPPPLPNVKGTMGGIGMSRSRPWVQGDPDPSSPLPNTPSTSKSTVTPVNHNTPVFRSDPTMKSCFDTLSLERQDELKKLFMIA
ncbi:hypothetical protein P7C73_g1378, partial [Tremellales sp. Uapishka_1]